MPNNESEIKLLALPRASILARMAAWALRSDVERPLFELHPPKDGESFEMFRQRVAMDLGALADRADLYASRFKTMGSRAKDALASTRAFVAAYPIIGALIYELAYVFKYGDDGMVEDRFAAMAGLEKVVWGVEARRDMIKCGKLHESVLAARADPDLPLPGIPRPISPGKLAMFGGIVFELAKLLAITVAAPLSGGSFVARFEPRGRVAALGLLAKALRQSAQTVAEADASSPREVFEGLLDARSALLAFGGDKASHRASVAIIQALALERAQRRAGIEFGGLRHQDCLWITNRFGDDRFADLSPIEERRGFESTEAFSKDVEGVLVCKLLNDKHGKKEKSELVGALAAWICAGRPPPNLKSVFEPAWAHYAGISVIEEKVYESLRAIHSPSELPRIFYKSLNGQDVSDRERERDRAQSLVKSKVAEVAAAGANPISTGLGWCDCLIESSESQGWPEHLRRGASEQLARTCVMLWICAPGNKEVDVPNLPWDSVPSGDLDVCEKLLSAASAACAPIAQRLGLSGAEFAQSIGRVIFNYGIGILQAGALVPFADPKAAHAVCAKALAGVESELIASSVAPCDSSRKLAARRI